MLSVTQKCNVGIAENGSFRVLYLQVKCLYAARREWEKQQPEISFPGG